MSPGNTNFLWILLTTWNTLFRVPRYWTRKLPATQCSFIFLRFYVWSLVVLGFRGFLQHYDKLVLHVEGYIFTHFLALLGFKKWYKQQSATYHSYLPPFNVAQQKWRTTQIGNSCSTRTICNGPKQGIVNCLHLQEETLSAVSQLTVAKFTEDNIVASYSCFVSLLIYINLSTQTDLLTFLTIYDAFVWDNTTTGIWMVSSNHMSSCLYCHLYHGKHFILWNRTQDESMSAKQCFKNIYIDNSSHFLPVFQFLQQMQ